MSDAHTDEHSSLIKTPRQLVVVIIFAFVVPIAIAAIFSQLVTTGIDTSKQNPSMSDEAVSARIKPVGQVAAVDPNAPVVEKSGKEIVDSACNACHGTGALNAPKIGDKAAWGKLIARGLPSLTDGAIKGIRNMPARGGNADLSDVELGKAIVYMANQSGGNLKEPAAKPAVAPAAKK